ncbi:MAG TPA: D-alanyl-D-alanine carboxypeptidase [Streptosporangiaceae bacterium]|jgi:D-alanyl-D-alanine carboxypeptidase (penicillin-binding protein 5/6)
MPAIPAAIRASFLATLAVLTVVGVTPAATAKAAAAARPASAHVDAAAGELINLSAHKELWGREQKAQRPVASITKVMTALVVIRAGDLRRRIRISSADVEYAASHDASNAGLHAGDVLTARALLYAMLLPSGADAAIALADSYGPGVTAFVRKMNTLTRKLGMTATHFTNFDGLLSSDVSTPGNLLRLGKAAMAQRAFRNVVKRKWYTLRAWPHRHHYFWRNTNLLLRRYPGVIGIKTGWTPDAGECLLFEATHRKKTLIGVVLDSAATNSGFTFVDAARLLNWGFGLHVPIPPPTPPPVTPKHAAGG